MDMAENKETIAEKRASLPKTASLSTGAFTVEAENGRLRIYSRNGMPVEVDYADVDEFVEFINKHAYDVLRDTRNK